MRTLKLFQEMHKGGKHVSWVKGGKLYPLNFVTKTNELLCKGYVVYWYYATNIQPEEQKAEDILIVCELNDVFLKSYQDFPPRRN